MSFVSHYYVIVFGNHDVKGHIVWLRPYFFVHQLEIKADADFECFSVAEQTVIVAFSSAHAVAVAVESHGRNNHHLDIGHGGRVVSGGFFDVERAESQTLFVVGEDVEIDPVDAWQIEMLVSSPLGYE